MVETGLGRWMLVVTVISVDAYSFLAFSNLTCHIEDRGIGVFWLHSAAWCSDCETSPSVGKNIATVLVPCHAWKCVPTAISGIVDISEVPGCCLLQQLSSHWGSQKLIQGLVSHGLTAYLSVFNLFLIQWIMVILSKGSKPDNFEPHNSLKLSFANVRGLVPILLNVNLPLNQTLLTFLLYVRQTCMTQLILAISLWRLIFL